jgi:phage shock protein A
MGIFDRLFRIGKSEANAVVDKLEDPSKISDQIIRELRENYQQAIEGEAQIKAIALGHRSDEAKARTKAAEWEKKANDLLDMMDHGKLDAEKGNELAGKAAEESQNALKQADELASMAAKEEAAIKVMDAKIKKIKDQIADAENRAEMLKARAKTADVSEKINKTLSSVDTDGLMATLDRMDKKVTSQEFTAQAYAEIDDVTMSTTQEIDSIIGKNSSNSALDALKAKRATKTSPVVGSAEPCL